VVVQTGSEAVSAREAEVLQACGDHLTNAEIAAKLHISVRTVESHVSSLLRKLGAADRRALATLAATGGGASSPATAPTIAGLPGTWTSFVGRRHELEVVAEAIASSRLVTLSGPGGVGKTRLVVEVARGAAEDFSAGGAFVDLVPVAPEFMVQAVASVLEVSEQPPRTLNEMIYARLGDGPFLLVLDNCEHVLAAAAHLAESILATCPQAVVLATSREPLGVAGERVVAVSPLGLTADDGSGSEAERLFIDRTGALDEGSQAPALINEICRRVDGMPLAIELAAARSRTLGLDGLLAGLDDRLGLLSRSGEQGERHGSLRSVIGWSYDLLDDLERSIFRRLAVFASPFDLAAATHVAATDDVSATSAVIGRLADKSLLVHARDNGKSRWRMLDTIRDFASHLLASSGEHEDVRRRHLSWALATAKEIEISLAESRGWRSRFDEVVDDLRGALAFARPEEREGFELALVLGHIAYARRFLSEARDHFRQAVAQAPNAELAISALRSSADVAFAEMRGELAFDSLVQASTRAGDAGDNRAAAIALAQAAALGARCPALFEPSVPYDALIALIDRAKAIAPDDDLAVAANLALAVAWACPGGRVDPERGAANEALELARRLGDPVLISNGLDAAACAASAIGEFKEYSRLSAERLTLLDLLPRHDPRVGGEVADTYHMATEAALAAGELPQALANATASVHDETTEGLNHFAANHLIIPLALQGKFDDVMAQASIMQEGWERAGRPRAGWMAPSFFAVAMVHGLRGDREVYREWWDRAKAVCLDSANNSLRHFAEARVAVHLGELKVARAVDDLEHTGSFRPFALAMSIEVAAFTGARDAEDRLAASGQLAEENDFAAAQLMRATGILREDPDALERSVELWEHIGARFERACTLLLVPSRASEGELELRELGCPLPVSGRPPQP